MYYFVKFINFDILLTSSLAKSIKLLLVFFPFNFSSSVYFCSSFLFSSMLPFLFVSIFLLFSSLLFFTHIFTSICFSSPTTYPTSGTSLSASVCVEEWEKEREDTSNLRERARGPIYMHDIPFCNYFTRIWHPQKVKGPYFKKSWQLLYFFLTFGWSICWTHIFTWFCLCKIK